MTDYYSKYLKYKKKYITAKYIGGMNKTEQKQFSTEIKEKIREERQALANMPPEEQATALAAMVPAYAAAALAAMQAKQRKAALAAMPAKQREAALAAMPAELYIFTDRDIDKMDSLLALPIQEKYENIYFITNDKPSEENIGKMKIIDIETFMEQVPLPNDDYLIYANVNNVNELAKFKIEKDRLEEVKIKNAEFAKIHPFASSK